MSKRRRRANQQNRTKKPVLKQPKKSLLRRGFELSLSTILAFLAIAGFYISIFPRPTVSPEGPTDPVQPFSLLVTITNSSVIPLRNVIAKLQIIEIASGLHQAEARPASRLRGRNN